MADYVFTKGTALKKDMFTKIVQLFTSAGWTNVSSNPTTDFTVLHSKGESDDKDLFIQLRAFNTAETTTSIETTDTNAMSYRFIEGYEAGADGASGTFTRPTEVWTPLYIAPSTTSVNREVELEYYYSINKNRLIIVIETPVSVNLAPILLYLGLPDTTYTTESGSRGVIFGASAYPKTNNTINISNASDGLPSDPASSNRTPYVTLAPKNPNSAGLFTLSEILYGNTTEGIRGKLTGIYQMPNGNVNNGDTIVIGSKEYRVVATHIISGSSFSSNTFVIQMV